jgi:hypothetical protein
MLVLLLAVIAFLGLNVWILVTSVRSGVYRLRGGGVRTPGSTAPHVSFTVSRDDSPGMFWLLAAFNACLVLVVAYVVYVMSGLTYQALLAGEWQ